MDIFEIVMLVGFGLAWPFSIIKAFKTKSTKNKAPVFMISIIIGYIGGIIHKILYNPDFVLYLYVLNMLMVSADLALYFRYRHLERKGQRA